MRQETNSPAESKANRISELNDEMRIIHSTNRSFWAQAQDQTKAARAQYYFRKDRFEKIRDELGSALLRPTKITTITRHG